VRRPRFFAPQAESSGSTIELPEDEASQLTRVLRLQSGDDVHVFNGRGGEWTATVAQASKQSVRVTLRDPVVTISEPRLAITLAIAVLKGDKMDDIVRDAVMLGVSAIQPILTARTEIAAANLARSGRVARWQRIAVSSAKQCGRAVVPNVRSAQPIEGVFALRAPLVMLVEPGTATRAVSLADLPPIERPTVLVGPEGGWTVDELAQGAAAGAMLVTLGGQTIRADAVPLVAITALRVHWNDF
jgi:16S rRNA (uracil1498-N3)-methyltransferase